jgi:uncharacterized membrane protein YhdT
LVLQFDDRFEILKESLALESWILVVRLVLAWEFLRYLNVFNHGFEDFPRFHEFFGF